MSDPGTLFESLASTTWQRLSDGEALNIRQGETAITDHLLLEIARLRHPGIRILKTPQDLEDTKGTDWEWWVGNSARGWLRYAMQAKRVDIETGRYDNLGHKVGSDLQADVLGSFAATNGAIPMYCFYNSVVRSTFAPFWHCKRAMEPEQLGCSVTPLFIVKKALAKRGARQFDWIHAQGHSLPWRCLLRCPAFTHMFRVGDGSLPTGGLSEAARFFGVTPVLHPSLPLELLQKNDFLDPQIIRGFDPDFYNSEIGIYPRRIAVITVSGEPTEV